MTSNPKTDKIRTVDYVITVIKIPAPPNMNIAPDMWKSMGATRIAQWDDAITITDNTDLRDIVSKTESFNENLGTNIYRAYSLLVSDSGGPGAPYHYEVRGEFYVNDELAAFGEDIALGMTKTTYSFTVWNEYPFVVYNLSGIISWHDSPPDSYLQYLEKDKEKADILHDIPWDPNVKDWEDLI